MTAIRLRGSLHGLKLDSGRFTKALDSAAQTLVRQSAREGIRAMIVQVPVWTGEALGSVKFASGPNGNLSRFLNVSIPISPREYRRGKNQYTGGAKGHYNFTAQRHIYTFLFRSDVLHFFLNNFFARTDSGKFGQQIEAPWGALELMRDAFETYLRANVSKLPKVHDFILKVPINLPFG